MAVRLPISFSILFNLSSGGVFGFSFTNFLGATLSSFTLATLDLAYVIVLLVVVVVLRTDVFNLLLLYCCFIVLLLFSRDGWKKD